MIDRLSRWQTPVVLGALLFLVVASGMEGEWLRAGELALMAAVWMALRPEARERSVSQADRLAGWAFVVALVGAPVALLVNAVEGSWFRAAAWALAAAMLVLTGVARRGGRASPEPVTEP